jgi:outer membrane murein-binding lipoprotein Lpp
VALDTREGGRKPSLGIEAGRNTMRQGKYLLLLAVAAIAVSVPIAQGTTAAKDPRVTKLIKTVNALKGQVASLQSDADALRSEVDGLKQTATTLTTGLNSLQNCVRYKVAPVTQYGTGTQGYLYGDRNQFTGDIFFTTALDFTQQGQTPQAYFVEMNPSCVSAAVRSGATTSRRQPHGAIASLHLKTR